MGRRWGRALLAAAALAGAAAAGDAKGPAVPPTATVAGRTLQLKGTAVQSMLWFEVYSVALYLESPVASAAEAIASEQSKELRLVVRHGATRSQIGAALREGMRKAGADLSRLKPRLDALLAVIPDMKAGDCLRIDYLPGGVTRLTDGRGRSLAIEGKDFADALLGIWLGPAPEMARIRRALLGERAAQVQARAPAPSRP